MRIAFLDCELGNHRMLHAEMADVQEDCLMMSKSVDASSWKQASSQL